MSGSASEPPSFHIVMFMRMTVTGKPRDFKGAAGKPIRFMRRFKFALLAAHCGKNIWHHLEIHECNPVIDMTKKAREMLDGKEPYRDLQTVIAAMRQE